MGLLNTIVYKIKYTMRFSILTIFITLFVTCIILLTLIIYIRFSQSISNVAFQLMRQTSVSLYEKIDSESDDITNELKLFSNLVSSDVIDTEDNEEIIEYMRIFLTMMAESFPSIQSVYFADEQGNFFTARKAEHGVMELESIDRSLPIPKRTISLHNGEGKIIKSSLSKDFSYDPRVRPWYTLAKQKRKLIWTDVYPYRLTGYLGITTALPIYTTSGKLKGVIGFNLRLDYIRRFIESLEISPNGIVYIVNMNGKVMAFPHLVQYKNGKLITINQLKIPWLIASFEEYKKNPQLYFKFRYGDENYLAIYRYFPKLENWLIGIVAPEKDFIKELLATNVLVILLSSFILSLGILLMLQLVNKIVNPLRKVVEETERIKNFDLNSNIAIQSRIKEIDKLGDAIYKMKQGLRSFKKYVPANLVRKLIESEQGALIGGEKAQIAVFFSDIENFTSISEEMEPGKLMKYICTYFNEISPIIEEEYGTIDKYIGDSVMAFWGAPLPVEKPCHSAARSALRVIKRIKELNQHWVEEGNTSFNTRIGIHFGEAIIGNIGSADRLNYTAIGDVINTTSRLESINKVYGTKIIVSNTVYNVIKHDFALRLIDSITLKGRSQPVYIYELLAQTKEELPFDLNEYQNNFAMAFSAYQKLQLKVALTFFKKCLTIYPGDSVAQIFIDRCRFLQQNPNIPEWQGIWHMYEK